MAHRQARRYFDDVAFVKVIVDRYIRTQCPDDVSPHARGAVIRGLCDDTLAVRQLRIVEGAAPGGEAVFAVLERLLEELGLWHLWVDQSLFDAPDRPK